MRSATPAARRRVVVTGIGVRTCLGHTAERFFQRLVAGESGIGRHPVHDLTTEVAWVDFRGEDHFTKPQLRVMDRVSQMAVLCARDAVQAADLTREALPERTGVLMGTAVGSMASFEGHFERHFSGLRPHAVVPAIMPNSAASHVAIQLGVTGACQTFSSACAASTQAMGEGFHKVASGYLDVALVGGSESGLMPGFMAAWEAMGVLADSASFPSGTACRPFSADRNGVILGEGAAMLVLEPLEAALARGAHPICELIGYGESSDASHIVAPDPAGQARAMTRALADAGLAVEDIDYVHAHATGTGRGDAVEAEAIGRVFGGRAAQVPVSSTKSAHGHLLGAGGAVEGVAVAMALQRKVVPPTTHWHAEDPACPFDCVPGKGRAAATMRHAMLNSFGFGGSNAVLVMKAWA